MTNPVDPSDPFSPTDDELEIARRMITTCLKDEGRRSLDEERVFMENLLVQRLNFFLVVFSIFVVAGFAAKTNLLSAIVFFAGTCICYLMAKIVYRAHVKHHWIMRLFYHQPEPATEGELPHAIKFINDAMKSNERQKKTSGSVSKWVGARIPSVCWGFLLVCALVSVVTLEFGPTGGLSGRLRAVIGGAESTLTFTDPAGKDTVRKGRISYEVYGTTIEVTVVDASGKVSILVLPVDRFVSIEH